MRKFLLGLVLALGWASGASAQNITCATRPPGDNSNACADTAFVTAAILAAFPATLPAFTVIGNNTGSPAAPVALTSMLISSVNTSFSGAAAAYQDSNSVFGGFNVTSLLNSSDSGLTRTVNQAYGTLSVARFNTGNWTNGPANSDYGAIISSFKGANRSTYLTTTNTGEIDGLWVTAAQGVKDDVGGIDVGVSKVQTGTSPTGGAVGVESSVSWVAPTTGTVNYSFHGVQGFAEGAGGRSGNTGYGMYIESFAGTGYAAYYGGADNSTYGGSPAWQYLIVGATSRAAAPYFTVAAGTGSTTLTGANTLIALHDTVPTCSTTPSAFQRIGGDGTGNFVWQVNTDVSCGFGTATNSITVGAGPTITLNASTLKVTGVPSSGTAAGSVCLDTSNRIYIKTTTGACL